MQPGSIHPVRGRSAQAGFYVTEVKVGPFMPLECGGKPDA
jgi:hypothetical protein